MPSEDKKKVEKLIEESDIISQLDFFKSNVEACVAGADAFIFISVGKKGLPGFSVVDCEDALNCIKLSKDASVMVGDCLKKFIDNMVQINSSVPNELNEASESNVGEVISDLVDKFMEEKKKREE